MISNPRLVLLGAAAQAGIFMTLLGALVLGFTPAEAYSIGIIGGADGPTSIFLSSKLAPHLLGAIAIAAYSYMALVPVIQPPIMKLLTSKKERCIRMKPPRTVTQREKIFFPIIAFMVCAMIVPGSISLVGMLFFGNLLKESFVTERLAQTARTALIDIVTIILGVTVGASTHAQTFLTTQSILIFGLGAFSFAIATASGVMFAKFMNLFMKEGNKINPLVGAAGVSAVPDSARVAQMVGLENDPNNHLLMHAMAPNVSGVIGSAVVAGVLWSMFVK
jgi:carboxybiotin decarboxylase